MDNYKEMLIDKNLYKRGFLLLKRQEKLPSIVSEWEQIELPTDLLLAYEAGNQCFFGSFSGGWLCLCGSYCMDVAAGHMSFRSVGEKMLRSLQQSQELFFDYLDVLNGRFVCIYSFGDSVFVLNDATGSRSVFYSTEKPALASHYNLLHEAIGGEEDPFYQKFSTLVIQKQKEHKIQPWVLPGDMTPYKNVRILVPNHLLELSQMKMQRFWPRKNMRALDVDEACNYIALSIKKEAELLCRHYKVFESLTAGTDSRITLAAVKNVAKDITFFTYHNVATKVAGYELCDREQNFKFASDLCRKEGLSFVEIQFEENEISPLLRAIYKKNHYHLHLPHLIPHYHSLFTEGGMHLRSNLIEICRDMHIPVARINSDEEVAAFARFMNWRDSDFCFAEVCQIYKSYFHAIEATKNSLYDYSEGVIVYWEHRMGSWLSGAVLTISDFASDTFQLFNCRKILEQGLSLPTYLKNRNIIYDGILKQLWPDLLDYGMPNSTISLYDMVDKNPTGLFYTESRISYNSGNYGDAKKKTAALYELRTQGISFGFCDNKLEKDDFCEISFKTKVASGLSYLYQFLIKTPWFQNVSIGNIRYEILINGQVMYSLMTTDYFSINQISICFQADKEEEKEVKIRLIALKDIDSPSYCGMLDILSLDIKRDFSRNYTSVPVVIDTFGMIKSHCLIKQ